MSQGRAREGYVGRKQGIQRGRELGFGRVGTGGDGWTCEERRRLDDPGENISVENLMKCKCVTVHKLIYMNWFKSLN